MYMKFAAASLFAIGMATSAFAQANPPQAPTNSGANTPSSSQYDSTGNNGSNSTTPMLDPNATNSTTNSSSPNGGMMGMPKNKPNCPELPTGGSLQTQGGNSGTTTSDSCPDNK